MEPKQNNLDNIEKKTRNDVQYKRDRVIRVIVQMRNGTTSAGTGFFITENGEILTCAHVISGTELRNLKSVDFRTGPNFLINETVNTTDPNTDHIKLQNYLTQSIISIQVELSDKTRVMAEIVKLNEFYDVILLKLKDYKNKTPYFELDTLRVPEYDESTFFCGFQMTGGYDNPTQYPFSINRAVASAYPEVEVGGGRYEHIQLNSINLGGNSGAPLFIEGSNTVIGMINGNMNWNGNVPLCIAYATPIKLIKDKADIL